MTSGKTANGGELVARACDDDLSVEQAREIVEDALCALLEACVQTVRRDLLADHGDAAARIGGSTGDTPGAALRFLAAADDRGLLVGEMPALTAVENGQTEALAWVRDELLPRVEAANEDRNFHAAFEGEDAQTDEAA